jgi:hypothetical protein
VLSSRRLYYLVIAVMVATTGCGAGVGPSPGPTPITSGYLDPTGDAFGAGLGTNWDITSVKTLRTGSGGSYTTLQVDITFTTSPSIPAPGSAGGTTHVVGFVEFDTDQDAATGVLSNAAAFCPGGGPSGIEFYVNLFTRNANGTYDVVNAVTAAKSGEATPSVSGNTLTLTVPLSAMGNDDGATNMDTVLGNGAEPTDCAPDAGGAVITRPQGARWQAPVYRR